MVDLTNDGLRITTRDDVNHKKKTINRRKLKITKKFKEKNHERQGKNKNRKVVDVSGGRLTLTKLS